MTYYPYPNSTLYTPTKNTQSHHAPCNNKTVQYTLRTPQSPNIPFSARLACPPPALLPILPLTPPLPASGVLSTIVLLAPLAHTHIQLHKARPALAATPIPSFAELTRSGSAPLAGVESGAAGTWAAECVEHADPAGGTCNAAAIGTDAAGAAIHYCHRSQNQRPDN
ncbi:hypothetical protein BC938DRAFT_483989 [Jimgerdemannia flammicorona]|uniref:Uncharacterized protein n=1 Tax=Jimgerdemannia flammicorona TaxID=994334 RepID=A0A433QAY5_9FUNG|nr:hypothetical protein BC938DRAFT_483989 [Jimgerdemannia flammicorona]